MFRKHYSADGKQILSFPTHICTLAMLALLWFLLSFEVGTHWAIWMAAEVVEYRPRLTMISVMLGWLIVFILLAYYHVYIRGGGNHKLGFRFWFAVIGLPILAGLAEYGLLQARFNANNYEECYSYDLDGKRVRSPYFEELVELQIWKRDGGCKLGSWSDK